MYSNVILKTNYHRRRKNSKSNDVFPCDVTLSSLKECCEELLLATSDNSLSKRPGALSQLKESEVRKLAMVKGRVLHISYCAYTIYQEAMLFPFFCFAMLSTCFPFPRAKGGFFSSSHQITISVGIQEKEKKKKAKSFSRSPTQYIPPIFHRSS